MIRQKTTVENVTVQQRTKDLSKAFTVLQSGSHQSLMEPAMGGRIILADIPCSSIPVGLSAALPKSSLMLGLHSRPCAVKMTDVAVLVIVTHLWK